MMGTIAEDMESLAKAVRTAYKQAAENIKLLNECKMRRFYLERYKDVDPDKTSGTGVIAEGVIFEDGTVALRWKTRHTSSVFYANISDVVAIHGHGGSTIIRFIDPEKGMRGESNECSNTTN